MVNLTQTVLDRPATNADDHGGEDITTQASIDAAHTHLVLPTRQQVIDAIMRDGKCNWLLAWLFFYWINHRVPGRKDPQVRSHELDEWEMKLFHEVLYRVVPDDAVSSDLPEGHAFRLLEAHLRGLRGDVVTLRHHVIAGEPEKVCGLYARVGARVVAQLTPPTDLETAW